MSATAGQAAFLPNDVHLVLGRTRPPHFGLVVV
jgi:hypothetical protein